MYGATQCAVGLSMQHPHQALSGPHGGRTQPCQRLYALHAGAHYMHHILPFWSLCNCSGSKCAKCFEVHLSACNCATVQLCMQCAWVGLQVCNCAWLGYEYPSHLSCFLWHRLHCCHDVLVCGNQTCPGSINRRWAIG